MLLDSAIYVVFLVLVVAIYWRLQHRSQNLLLLGASYFFYAWWDWRFLLLMIGSTVADYYFAKRIGDDQRVRHRRSLLFASLALNFGFLAYFKYFNFFIDSFASVADSAGLHNIPHALWKVILTPSYLVLYLSGSGLYRRCVSSQAGSG